MHKEADVRLLMHFVRQSPPIGSRFQQYLGIWEGLAHTATTKYSLSGGPRLFGHFSLILKWKFLFLV
jgi:hypothetical protein